MPGFLEDAERALYRPIFTTGRIAADGAMTHQRWHRARLLHDLGVLWGRDGDIPRAVDAALAEATGAVQTWRGPDGMFRIAIGRTDAAAGLAHRVFVGPSHRRPVGATDAPLRLALVHDARGGPPVKSCDRAFYRRADAEARAAGADAALLVFGAQVREGTWFHLFARFEGRWITPALGDGVMFGTTRARILARGALMGSPAAEGTLTLEALVAAERCVAVSALAGLWPVERIGGHGIEPGPSPVSA